MQSDSCERASCPKADVPASQAKQLVLLLLAELTEYVPATQFVHAAPPVAILYLPATHALQVSPSSPVYPELQIQSV